LVRHNGELELEGNVKDISFYRCWRSSMMN